MCWPTDNGIEEGCCGGIFVCTDTPGLLIKLHLESEGGVGD